MSLSKLAVFSVLMAIWRLPLFHAATGTLYGNTQIPEGEMDSVAGLQAYVVVGR